MNIFWDKITRLLCQINKDESLSFNSIGKENTFPIWLTFLQKNSSAMFATFIATNLFMLSSSLNWSLSQERSNPLLEDKRFYDQFSTFNLEMLIWSNENLTSSTNFHCIFFTTLTNSWKGSLMRTTYLSSVVKKHPMI